MTNQSISTLFYCCLFLIFSFTLSAQHIPIWDGEDPNSQDCGLNDYMIYNNTDAYDGQWCLEGSFTPWKSPTLQLNNNCWSEYRESIAYTQQLCFQIKANEVGFPLALSLYAWHSPGNTCSEIIDATSYLSNGQLSTTYQQVCIPLEDFATGPFTALWLESVDFYVDNPPDNFKIYVDDIFLKDTLPTAMSEVSTLSNQTIKINFTDRYDSLSVKTLGNYTLSSTSDPNYATPVAPSKAGFHYMYDGVENDILWLNLAKAEFMAYLVFDAPLQNNTAYTLTMENMLDPAGNQSEDQSLTFEYSDLIDNGSVKVNQIGYRPESPKFAYVGNYLGTAGMMDIAPSTFKIIDANTQMEAYSGPLNFRGFDTSMSGEKLYDADFSAFNQAGEYYIYVPGIGKSPNFEICTGVYNDVLRIAVKGLYLQRCGIEMPADFAGDYARPACHQNDAHIHSSVANTATYNGETIGAPKEVIGGWHDAGDYSRPLDNQVVVIYDLLLAHELFPEKCLDDWGLPTSGNGIPDILDEVKWGLDFMMKMQSDDGGVHFKVATTYYPQKLAHEDDATYYLSAKTTHITAQYAAIMARAARHFENDLPAYSNLCLEKATAAWQFLQQHTTATPSDGYKDESLDSDLSCGQAGDGEGDWDERAWAAAELYRTTGTSTYADAFANFWAMNDPSYGWSRSIHSQKRANFCYLNITDFPTDDNIRAQIITHWTADANVMVDRSSQNFYRSEYRSDVPDWIGWGSYSQSTDFSTKLLRAWKATDDENYLYWATINLDPQFGNNPLSRSYITGVGDHPVSNPIHYPSQLDGIAAPIPGIPLYGVFHSPGWNMLFATNQFITYPAFWDPVAQEAIYPTLRRHFDQQRIFGMNEFTVSENMGSLILSLVWMSDPTNENCIPLDCSSGSTSVVSCDDDNLCTINDVETILDNDGTVCVPCAGVQAPCSTDNICESSMPCNDNDPCTINDFEIILLGDGSVCQPCAGTPIGCSNGPTSVTTCDDGDPCTVNDIQTILDCDGAVCIPCEGAPTNCPNGSTSIVPCDDGDSYTYNDMQTILDCDGSICITCMGIPVDCSTGSTSVVPCDDGNPCTIGDVETILDSDGTVCIPCAGVQAPCDTDNICESSVPCDDNDPCTINDFEIILLADGSVCQPCAGSPIDCDDGTTSVTTCDDGDPCTINDVQTTLDCDGSVCVPCAGQMIPFDTTFVINGDTITVIATGLSFQWLDCDNSFSPITGANLATFVANQSGNYAVEISYGGCIDTSACFEIHVTTVSTNDSHEAFSLNLFPNPVTNVLQIDISDQVELPLQLEIFDVKGRALFTTELHHYQSTIDMESFASGMYFIAFTNSEVSVVRKVVKQE